MIYNTKTKQFISVDNMAEETKNQNVVFFGEFHDDSLLHSLQYSYLKSLYSVRKEVVVSMEMFERDNQNVVNDYLSGKINEDDFIKNSRPWPDYKKFYKPLLELAKENKKDLIAANIPRKYAALYAQQGWSGIDTINGNDRKFVAKTMRIKEDDYRDKFFETMLPKDEKLSDQTPNQLNTLYLYYGAQCIKDETMAESIFNYLEDNDDNLIVHFDGDFHSNSFLGTVQKFIDRADNDYKINVITPIYFDKKEDIKLVDTLDKLANYIIFLKEPVREPMPPMVGAGGPTHLGENSCELHDIQLNIDPVNQSISGIDNIKFKNPVVKTSSLKMLKSLEVKNVNLNGKKIEYSIKPVDELYNEITFTNSKLNNLVYGDDKNPELNTVTIEYAGKVYNKPNETNLIQRHSHSAGIISAEKNEGIYLPGSSFYPKGDFDISNFKATITIPKEFGIVTSCIIDNKLSEDGKNNIYTIKTDFPIDDMILCGGKYVEYKKNFDSIEFKMYTFDSTKFAKQYLDASIDYYKYYTKILGKYPFKDFTIVENFFATGFGMPGYTLLSGKLMAMPWVTLSPGSLAHEFVHNWWGNSVFTDYNAGNWCEALTTFSTNYYYNILNNNPSGAKDWRKQSLIGLDALPKEKNYPVVDFKYQKDNYDATVGYQKGGFIFYEIMKLMGDESFFNSLKTFAEKYKGKRAYWSNLASSFEAQCKKDSIKHPIKNILNKWLKNTELPKISLENVKFSPDSIEFTIRQNNNIYMTVPVYLNGVGGEKRFGILLKDSVTKVTLKENIAFDTLRLDPNYESLRKLYAWEKPFSFNRTLNDKPIVVMPEMDSPDYKIAQEFVVALKESEYDFKVVDSKHIETEDVVHNSMIILGNIKNNKMIKAYQKQLESKLGINEEFVFSNGNKGNSKDFIGLLNIDHLVNPEKLVTIIYFTELNNADPLKRFFHYLTYSGLLLNSNKSGRPLVQVEIFPQTTNKPELEAIRK